MAQRENFSRVAALRRSSRVEDSAFHMVNKPNRGRRLLLISGTLALLLGIASIPFLEQQIRARAQDGTASAQEKSDGDHSNRATGAPSTFVVSNAQADQLLQRNVDQAIDSSDAASASWGGFVMSLRDGRVLYARDGDRSFIPASNMKLYTTGVALDLLGADYRWRTSVYAASRPDKSGVINEDLTLYGRGAPDLVVGVNDKKSSLKQLADELYANGLRHVRGNVVGDESYFRGEPLGDGWLWNDVQWYFGAEISALSIGGNEISLNIVPGAKVHDPARLKLAPETEYVQMKNDAVTAEEEKPTTIGINRGLSDNAFRVWGDFPLKSRGFNARLAVHQPALWAAKIFRDELLARGITVDGHAISRDARSQRENERFDPQREVELASITSKTLGELSRSINKESLNLEAELVLRTLGKVKGGTAPDPDPRKMANRGDDDAGLAVIRLWLEQTGISTQGMALHDGSGLSRLNFVTPETTVRLLAAMSKKSLAGVFHDSLSIAGRDGTLRNRLRTASTKIYAKTGTLNYVNSLSGYVVSEDKELLAFSIMCNNDMSPSTSTHVLDRIALLLSTYEGP